MNTCRDCPTRIGSTRTLCDACRAASRRLSNAVARQATRDAGECVHCGQPRGRDGTASHCRPCADRRNEYHRAWRHARVDRGLCASCGKDRGESINRVYCIPCAATNSEAKSLQRWRRKSEAESGPRKLAQAGRR